MFERGAGSFDKFSFKSRDAAVGAIDVTLSKRHVTVSEIGAMVWMGGLLLGALIVAHPRVVRRRRTLELGSGRGIRSLLFFDVFV